MNLMKDVLGILTISAIILIGHIATGDNGMKDIKDAISEMEKAINNLIRWINQQ